MKIILNCYFLCIVNLSFSYNIGYGEQTPLEIIEDGRHQYQLLREQTKLPRYGECWKTAVQRIHEGCRYLSENSQSDMTLHVTNCFLEMSGHETYNCHLDQKPNVRRICISMMSDRAFNTYTQFYTHMQNICWFIRGQIWHEKILEGTSKVGEQLSNSIVQQEMLLKQQEESLIMQKRLINNSKLLERVLNESRVRAEFVINELRTSVDKHQQVLNVMVSSLNNLQSWLIGEVSWLDTITFYVGTGIMMALITSTTYTASARLPVLVILCIEMIVERLLCSLLSSPNGSEFVVHEIHNNLSQYVWWCRNFCISICFTVVFIFAYRHKNLIQINHDLLLNIQEQSASIQTLLLKLDNNVYHEKIPVTPDAHTYNLRRR